MRNRLNHGIKVTPFFAIAWELVAWGHREWGIRKEDDAWVISLGHLHYHFRTASLKEIDNMKIRDIFTRDAYFGEAKEKR